ncbi:Diadenosine tetraphosphate (Ap4A) hydrolase [Marinospirillum celere]|uniref:Diadenosine tetraphosphate (Ap4A) hydrolase n=1 Tax=Marinospirillum celere TaxID=1122252 RepID=A0A1I1IMF2_9GAMM|nr:HIT family protein [Marinospirillum celere]SFC37417.1 Diadenosine tetraphosphate (Ap4A) hydrolase [Marinospirillum celere]
MPFTLHPRLEADSIFVGQLRLCQLRLINDSRYPWLLLVPAHPDLVEITDLEPEDYQQLWEEVRLVSKGLQSWCQPDKLNVATLGNLVPQLHLHVIARFKTDATWPGPVWGQGEAVAYTEKELDSLVAELRELFFQ